ncbi:MAG: hypothetical protein JXA24_02500 [Proteobacteria bacterium]|nr:hypothetical protein [Pseudomonadota bacterium]
MKRPPAVLIADRSRLAANLYRLLLAPTGLSLMIRQRAGEALLEVRRGARVDLMLLNSNSIGNDAQALVEALESRPDLRRIRKILIAGPSRADRRVVEALSGITGLAVVERPFHPEDLMREVQSCLGRGNP